MLGVFGELGGKGIIDLYKSRSWEKALETISAILDTHTRNSWTYRLIADEVMYWQSRVLSEHGVALQWSGVLIRGMFTKDQWTAFYNGAFLPCENAGKARSEPRCRSCVW